MSIKNIGSTTNIIAAPAKPVSKREILNEIKTQEKAKKAKEKPREERTLDDKIAIITDFINKIPEPQVCHANGNYNKLNVMA